MTTTLTIEREVHFRAQARGRKELRADPAPQGPPPDPGRVPRVSRLMALALRFEGLLRAGAVKDHADHWGLDGRTGVDSQRADRNGGLHATGCCSGV